MSVGLKATVVKRLLKKTNSGFSGCEQLRGKVLNCTVIILDPFQAAPAMVRKLPWSLSLINLGERATGVT